MRGQKMMRIGRRLYSEGLISGNFGNISIRENEGFSIKRTGAYLDEPGTLVFVPFNGAVPPDASRESLVHRTIYLKTQHQAIVHVHPLYAVVASFSTDEVVPVDCEGGVLCPRIPVVQGAPGTEELGIRVADALSRTAVVIARGHGTFAGGKTLEEAYLATTAAEHSCRILYLLGKFGGTRRDEVL